MLSSFCQTSCLGAAEFGASWGKPKSFRVLFFFLFTLPLSLLSFVGLIKWLSLFCKDILRFVSYLLRCVSFFGNSDEATSRGRTHDTDGFRSSVESPVWSVYVRAHVFSGNIVKLCSSRSSTFQFRVLQMAQQLWIISVSLYLIAARFLNRNRTSAIKEKVTMFQLIFAKILKEMLKTQ